MKRIEVYQPIRPLWNQICFHVDAHWFKFVLLLFAVYFFCTKDISLQFDMKSVDEMAIEQIAHAQAAKLSKPVAVSTSMSSVAKTKMEAPTPSKGKKTQDDRKAQTFYNLTFVLSPDYAERKGIDPSVAKHHVDVCKAYVERFAKIAILEQEKYGIPASITLAQGLLESNAGDSRLAKESANHFGIKCRSKCRGCTCRNYTDDSIYDMFRVFDSAWESYREHSILLTGKRYKHLLKLDKTDYTNWAHGLKKAGYATDKRYAHKLIKIIEQMDLNRFSRMRVKK